MKRLFSIFLFTSSFSLFSQKSDSLDFYTKIEAFIPNTKASPTYFYDLPKGLIIDSLKSSNEDEWIIITIDTKKGNWVKLKHVKIKPSSDSNISARRLSNLWIPLSELYTQLNDPTQSFTVYKSANKKSKQKNHPTVDLLNIIDIKDDWIKVKFTVNAKQQAGWISKFNVCAYPWTICAY
jgi:hypothetical protein